MARTWALDAGRCPQGLPAEITQHFEGIAKKEVTHMHTAGGRAPQNTLEEHQKPLGT